MVVVACLPVWYNATAPHMGCPHGQRLPMDVTLPEEVSFLQGLALVYSLVVPVALVVFGLACLVVQACRRSLRTHVLFVFFMPCLIILINEGILKRLISQPRPGATGLLRDDAGRSVGSCTISCGMPSSHSSLAMGLLVLLFLDAALRVGRASPAEPEVYESMERGAACCVSCAPQAAWTSKHFVLYMSFWTAMLLPIPVARLILYDHSVPQVVAGAASGICAALLWFILFERLLMPYCGAALGGRFCGDVVLHDYEPVRHSEEGQEVSDIDTTQESS